MKYLTPFICIIVLFLSTSCTTSGVLYSAKIFRDTILDNSFQNDYEPTLTGNLLADVYITPTFANISGIIREKYRKEIKRSLSSDILVNGKIQQHGWVKSDEFVFVFLLGLETEFYSFTGNMLLNNEELPITMDIYFLHDKKGSNRQFYTTDIKTSNLILHTNKSYHESEDSSPFMEFVSIGKDRKYYIYIAKTLNWNVHGKLSTAEKAVKENWPKIGIKSLLTIESQVLQVCDNSSNVLAEIVNNRNYDKYNIFIPRDDERYNELLTTVGLAKCYISVLKSFDELVFE